MFAESDKLIQLFMPGLCEAWTNKMSCSVPAWQYGYGVMKRHSSCMFGKAQLKAKISHTGFMCWSLEPSMRAGTVDGSGKREEHGMF